MKNYPRRKSPRLQGYDYSSEGAYFVTICTHRRLHLFGEILDGHMILNSAGEVAQSCWKAIPDHYPAVELDAYVVMPNHTHGILFLHQDPAQFKTILGRVINGYKGAVTARIRAMGDQRAVVWQSLYHDNIIRSEAALARIREYVVNNAAVWGEDKFYSEG